MKQYIDLKKSLNLYEDLMDMSDKNLELIIKPAIRNEDVIFIVSLKKTIESLEITKINIIINMINSDIINDTKNCYVLKYEDIMLLETYAEYIIKNYVFNIDFFDYFEKLKEISMNSKGCLNNEVRTNVRNSIENYLSNDNTIKNYKELSLMRNDLEALMLSIYSLSYEQLFLVIQTSAYYNDVDFIQKIDLIMLKEDDEWFENTNCKEDLNTLRYCDLCLLLKKREENNIHGKIEIEDKKISDTEKKECEEMFKLYSFLEAYRLPKKEKIKKK